ncbi:MAG: hypothetical protein ACT4PY_00690 [Armatimonadota bacterium]
MTVDAFLKHVYGLPHKNVAFAYYHDPAGSYASVVAYTSPDPNAVGHLLALRVQATTQGYLLNGEVTEEEDWEEGEREWRVLAEVRVADTALRRMLLFRAVYLTEFDKRFKGKRKHTGRNGENLVLAALRALSAPVYDEIPARNLRTVEGRIKEVEREVETSALEEVLLEAGQVRVAIDDIAFRIYGLETHRSTVENALRMVL